MLNTYTHAHTYINACTHTYTHIVLTYAYTLTYKHLTSHIQS